MRTLTALRVLSGKRRGSSRPVLVETSDGPKLVKLRGAGQGTGPLVAEIIVAELAAALSLSVPARTLIEMPAGLHVTDGDDELTDTLAASIGLNLGFDFLDDARDLDASQAVADVAPDDQTRILWLDRFTLNPDRTARNPNLLAAANRVWLIDHGAALFFQYDWDSVTEQSPRRPAPRAGTHLFAASVTTDRLAAMDPVLGTRITRAALDAAVAQVPDDFLLAMLADPSLVDRRRAAYAAYLWKRLKSPRSDWLS